MGTPFSPLSNLLKRLTGFTRNLSYKRHVSQAIHEKSYQMWIKKYEPELDELLDQKTKEFATMPKIHLITFVVELSHKLLADMIESVIAQSYSDWELHILLKLIVNQENKELVEELIGRESRIKFRDLSQSDSVIDGLKREIEEADGDFIAFVNCSDLIAPFTLFELVKDINQDQNIDFIYSDEDSVTENGNVRYNPFFKPCWSPDTLRSYNYIGRFFVIKKRLIEEIDYLDIDDLSSDNYDLVLRATERAKRILHIPKILYHRRKTCACESSSERAKQSLEQHIERLGLKGQVNNGLTSDTYKIDYLLTSNHHVSVIIPNKDALTDLQKCISSVIKKSSYLNYDITIIENGSKDQKVFNYYEALKNTYDNIQVLVWDKPFNYSAMNNYAVESTSGEYLVFLNNDTEVISSNWIEEMLMLCQRDDVGIVGARLLYPAGTIQHGGVILGIKGVSGHAHRNFQPSSTGYMKRLSVVQNLSATTGACLMTKRQVFNDVDGFNEDLAVAFNDVDFCLKVRDKSYLVIWTPYAELYHHEYKTRGLKYTPEELMRFSREIKYMKEEWHYVLDSDPYYNPNLTLEREDFSINV